MNNISDIRIANAPCSWGRFEFKELATDSIASEQMLDELRDTGYTGTELGDWGFMPTEPEALKDEMRRRDLTMVGAFVPVALRDPDAHAEGEAHVLEVARLLAAVAPVDAASNGPFLILADANGTVPVRTRNAGRVKLEIGLSADEWRTFASSAERIARAVRDETGLRAVFHHHCAGYIETPDEVAHLLDLTDPDLLGLVFDTGHYAYGTGVNDGSEVLAGLDQFADRIQHVHFKDCHPEIAERARAGEWDYYTAVGNGVFCELGKGYIDFPAVTAWLRAQDYRGWITVEQDVLPGMGTPKASAQRNREYLRTLGL
ncbi:MAG: TIM barrel protein [Chloroflexia bacterium]